jgi:hypothetical protein
MNAVGMFLPAMLSFVWVLALTLVPAQVARASDPADLCRAAAVAAASETGVPQEVLLAISLTETGRGQGGTLQPWPWTVNSAGEGHWFPDRAAAVRFAEAELAAGRTSFDVGCFQINLRWHGQAFASLDAMFDPLTNASYAARFLADLASEGGGWSEAAGAYHSRTAALAERYRGRFDAILAELADAPLPLGPEPDDGLPGYNHPLLQARDGQRTPGSLVILEPVPAT